MSFFLQGELLHAEEECLLFPKRSQVIQAAIVLIKEKNGKFQTFRVSATNKSKTVGNITQKFENVNVDEINLSCLLKWCAY